MVVVVAAVVRLVGVVVVCFVVVEVVVFVDVAVAAVVDDGVIDVVAEVIALIPLLFHLNHYCFSSKWDARKGKKYCRTSPDERTEHYHQHYCSYWLAC